MTAEERWANRVTTANAAKELGISAEDLRWGMENGYLHLGFVKQRPGAVRRHFVITRYQLEQEKRRINGGGLKEAVRQVKEDK